MNYTFKIYTDSDYGGQDMYLTMHKNEEKISEYVVGSTHEIDDKKIISEVDKFLIESKEKYEDLFKYKCVQLCIENQNNEFVYELLDVIKKHFHGVQIDLELRSYTY